MLKLWFEFVTKRLVLKEVYPIHMHSHTRSSPWECPGCCLAARYIPQSSMSSPTLPGKQLNQGPALNLSVPDKPCATFLKVSVIVRLYVLCIIYPVYRPFTVLLVWFCISPNILFYNRCIMTSWMTLLMLTSQLGLLNRKRLLCFTISWSFWTGCRFRFE